VGGTPPGALQPTTALMLVNQATYYLDMYEYEYRVRHGSLSFALLKPVHRSTRYFRQPVSKLITLPILLVVSGSLALIFHPTARYLVGSALVFILALPWPSWCASCGRTLALAAFWTTRVSAINQVYFILMLFLAGQIAPLTLFPRWLQIVADILPFRWMLGLPVELVLGRLTPVQALAGLAAQSAWAIISLVLVRVICDGCARLLGGGA